MTEKTLKAVEMGVTSALSVGVNYVVNKTIEKAVEPKNIPEKIITVVGAAGVDLACDYAIYKMVHGLLYPSETVKYEMLVEENIKAIQTNAEVAKVMAEHEVKVENAVDELYNKIMGGTVNG